MLTRTDPYWPFLTCPDPCQDNVDCFDFGKNWDLMTLDQNREKIEIKTIMRSSYHLLSLQKQYQNSILLLYWDYFNHISAIYVHNFAYISQIYDPFIILIKAIFQSFDLWKNRKIKTFPPPSSQSNPHFELWTFYFRDILHF